MEKQVQTRLIKFLKNKGCYVIKTQAAPGTPVGCPDVIALYEGWWGAFECKASRTAKWQPLQKETVQKLDDWSYASAVYPENIDQILLELETML